MTNYPGPDLRDICSSLTLLDAELYDDAIPFEDTARRLISVSEVAAQVIVSNVTRLPTDAARLLALSVQAVYRRDLLAAHVARTSPVTPRREQVWQFRRMPGTTAVFDGSPAAVRRLHGPLPSDGTSIEAVGPSADGFHRFRLHL